MQINFAIPPISHFRRWLGEFFFPLSKLRNFYHFINQLVREAENFLGVSRQSLRNTSTPLRQASPEATRFELHWGTTIRCHYFCWHCLSSRLTIRHRRMPASGHVFRPDFVPVSFSSFPFLRESITLLQSRQDGVAGTVTFKHIGVVYHRLAWGDRIRYSHPFASGLGKIDCRKRRVEVEGQFSKVSGLTVRNSRELFAVPVQIMCNFSWLYLHLTVDWLFCIVE